MQISDNKDVPTIKVTFESDNINIDYIVNKIITEREASRSKYSDLTDENIKYIKDIIGNIEE